VSGGRFVRRRRQFAGAVETQGLVDAGSANRARRWVTRADSITADPPTISATDVVELAGPAGSILHHPELGPDAAKRPAVTNSATRNGSGAPIEVKGKFLFTGEQKLFLRGVTYGTFVPDENGDEYPHPKVVERDFAGMAAAGINSVRTYTAPPRWLLDIAWDHGLRVMAGLAAERHVGYLNDGRDTPDAERRLREQVRACAGHPALLCYALGNEIPASIVRWFGRRRVQRWLRRLYQIVKEEDSKPVTYVNYPSTEYLELPFLDLVAFNVYLEDVHALEAYLWRLQNLAGDRPLLLAELGLDSMRNGEHAQASVLASQARTAFAAGCAGAFVYAWTDEWCAGGVEVDDWAFGLTDRQRRPKPALAAVKAAYAEVPFRAGRVWPKVSVVVCCYNSESTLEDCLGGLERLEYSNVEVIVVDDGSTDSTAAIAQRYHQFQLIQTENHGLSAARNTGLAAATGDFVAFLDSDAWPDPHWLHYLVATFETTDHACVGGPNLPPPGDGDVADCVARAPGGPNHVLLSDQEAEHVPGCNMAFRAAALRDVGGFDARFRVAGDDVDMCWRIREGGGTIGFSPAAVVWHHRRDSVRAYWKQQVGYGRAEALLEAKWPEKYNGAGHVSWDGRVYQAVRRRTGRAGHVYHGVWGTAPFQSLYEGRARVSSLLLMPEWWLVVAALVALSALGMIWTPLLFAFPLLCASAIPPVAQAASGAWGASLSTASRRNRFRLRVLTGLLHVVQPIGRLRGRLSRGLSPWRRRASSSPVVPRRWTDSLWSERWRAPAAWVGSVEAELQAGGDLVLRGGPYDSWDLEVRGGTLGRFRLCVAVEEHGGGCQLVRFRARPRVSIAAAGLVVLFGAIAVWAGSDRAWIAATALGGAGLLAVVRAAGDCALAAGALRRVLASVTLGTPGARS
jgi:GT2 family glycosyltransferase